MPQSLTGVAATSNCTRYHPQFPSAVSTGRSTTDQERGTVLPHSFGKLARALVGQDTSSAAATAPCAASSSATRKLQQAQLARLIHRLAARMHRELLIDALDVGDDCAWRDA